MYNDKLFLTPQEIFNKEFKIDAEGYRPKEVDQFLDMVIRDYTEFTNTANSGQANRSNINNIDVLKRISNLEKAVYGKEE